ncbi:MAG: S-layer homology domain-containing protein [Candidatus Metalachnospira sp.]|nr:S-layer homology domain-containing protein [Candidatus Metalachnospira sp.]
MKNIKSVTAFIVAAVMLFSVSAQALAANAYGSASGKPMLLESDITNTMAAAEKLGIIAYGTDKTAVVTKKELCRLIVRFYRAATGSTGITLSNSSFIDCDSNEVVFCSENAIVSGISDITFAPDNLVSREEMCKYAVNTLKFCGTNVISPGKDCISNFADKDSIDTEYADDINYLASINVAKGYDNYFYPKSYITYEQAASIFVEIYYQLMLSKVEINDLPISIGDSDEKTVATFGQPSYTFVDKEDGMTIWVYNKNLSNFFYIGIKNDKVSEIFSNSQNFTYRGISSGDNAKEVDFGSRGDRGKNCVIYSDGYGKVEIGWNPGTNKICYVYSCNNDVMKRHSITKVSVDGDISLLYDIVNAERLKLGLGVFKINKQVASAARLHSMNMAYWGYFDYNNIHDFTPFDRLKDKGVSYIMASENIACCTNVKDIYTYWINSAGSRSNMFSDYMDNAGIGLSVSSYDSKAYATMDFVKLKNIME